MARQGFKRGWTRIVPHPIERSTYMLFASLALIVMFLFWRPIPTTVWNIENPIGAVFMWALFAIGWAIVLMRSEEHTSELQSLMRISYAVFCLKTKKISYQNYTNY